MKDHETFVSSFLKNKQQYWRLCFSPCRKMLKGKTAFLQRSCWRTTTRLSRMLSMRAGTWRSHAEEDLARVPKPGNTSERSTSWSECPKDTTLPSTDPLISSITLSTDGLNAPVTQESAEEWWRTKKNWDNERERKKNISNNELSWTS